MHKKKLPEVVSTPRVFLGGGEMGRCINEFDWSKTTLGTLTQWPQSLITAVNIILSSQHPMWIGWGQDLIFIYNDAYISVLGLAKHPWALGLPAKQVWAEIWDVCGPLAERVMQKSESVFVDNVRLFMKRSDFLEEVYYSFSYSPIRNESGKVGGLFCPSAATTEKLLSERRLTTLNALSSTASAEKTIKSACASAMKILAKNRDDIPFALLYLIDVKQKCALLMETVGLEPNLEPISPAVIDLEKLEQPQSIWPIANIYKTPEEQIIPVANVDKLPKGLADQRVSQALILPLTLPGQTNPYCILITGVNPCCKLDAQYHTFYELLARQLLTAIQSAQTYEDERKRAELLAEIDKAKTVFFSNVSHEFRTPLTLMLSPLEDALTDKANPLPFAQRERIEMIQRNGLRLLKLVNSLLDFSRIEANRIQAVYEPTDIAELTANLSSLFRSTIEKANLQFIIDTPPLSEKAYVDKEMWEKIVFNLLSNAFKFTLKGTIRVALKEQNHNFILLVEDTGAGIPPSELSRLFERFHRVETIQGRSYEGTGIGLALTQELVKFHNGTIQVESQVGRGTTFKVAIPLGNAHLPSDKLNSKRETYQPGRLGNFYVEEAASWLVKDPSLAKHNLSLSHQTTMPALTVTSSAEQTSLPAAPSRILLADDNTDMRKYVKGLLEPLWSVEDVEDGEIALQSALKNPPDLVLSDVMMPKRDGFSLLKALRADPKTQAIPLILLSARAGEEAKIEGLQAGADDYLVKPFSAKELIARVETHLKISKIRKAAFLRETELLLEKQAAQADFESVLNNIKDGFILFNHQWQFLYVNPKTLESINKTKQEVLGKVYWDIYPDVIGTSLENNLRTAMEKGQVVVAEFFYPAYNRWYENRIYPHEKGICVISTDITTRKQLEQERQQAIELANQQQQKRIQEAEEHRKRQSEFSDTICHELRTPLNCILGGAELSNNTYQDLVNLFKKVAVNMPSQIVASFENLFAMLLEQLDIIKQSAEHQKVIVDDVLDLSKLTNNKKQLNPVPFNPKELAQHATGMFKAILEKKSLELFLDITKDCDTFFKADAHLLSQIIINLLSNAIKFTPKGYVKLRMFTQLHSADEMLLQVEVEDTGIGMTEEEIAQLFDHFKQANSSISAEFGGSGLGLVISKKIVEMMGGNITVKSKKNQGSQFSFTICCKLLTADEKLKAMQEKKLSTEKVSIANIGSKNILIVEDNKINQKVISQFLRILGHSYQVANNGSEAVKKNAEFMFDLIFMDMEMPVMDGIEATQHIRAQEKGSNIHVPIIGLSGNARGEYIEAAIKAGMDGYLIKPCHMETINQTIQKYAKIETNPAQLQTLKKTPADEWFYSKETISLFKTEAALLLQQHLPFQVTSDYLLFKLQLPVDSANLNPYFCALILKDLKEILLKFAKELPVSKCNIDNYYLSLQVNSVDEIACLEKFFNEVGLINTTAQVNTRKEIISYEGKLESMVVETGNQNGLSQTIADCPAAIFSLKKRKTINSDLPNLTPQKNALTILEDQLQEALLTYEDLEGADKNYIADIKDSLERIRVNQQDYPEEFLQSQINFINGQINKLSIKSAKK